MGMTEEHVEDRICKVMISWGTTEDINSQGKMMNLMILTLPNSPRPGLDDGVVVVLVLHTPPGQRLDVLGCFPDSREALLQGAGVHLAFLRFTHVVCTLCRFTFLLSPLHYISTLVINFLLLSLHEILLPLWLYIHFFTFLLSLHLIFLHFHCHVTLE